MDPWTLDIVRLDVCAPCLYLVFAKPVSNSRALFDIEGKTDDHWRLQMHLWSLNTFHFYNIFRSVFMNVKLCTIIYSHKHYQKWYQSPNEWKIRCLWTLVLTFLSPLYRRECLQWWARVKRGQSHEKKTSSSLLTFWKMYCHLLQCLPRHQGTRIAPPIC